jgi:Tol biopolymer transport system component
MHRTAARLATSAAVLIIAGPASGGPASAGSASGPHPDRVSVTGTGAQADGPSSGPGVSADGRFVAFSSRAGNLVAGDADNDSDVFLRDRRAGTTRLVSVSRAGPPADGTSFGAAVSADGRYVAFLSDATNLVHGDTNGLRDVFVRDMAAGTTTRVSVSSSGGQTTAGTGDDPASGSASISATGRYVAFSSGAPNLVAGDTNGTGDVFVHDVRSGRTVRASVSDTGRQAAAGGFNPSISADGRHVGFISDDDGLVRGDTNGLGDVFVRDLRTGGTDRVSVSGTGEQTVDGESYRINVALSATGRYAVFTSSATTLVVDDTNGAYDVFVHDRRTGATTRVDVSSGGTQADDDAYGPAVSADGRLVTFHSDADNLTPGGVPAGMSVFLHDRRAGTTRLVATTHTGAFSFGPEDFSVISADGRYVAFASASSALVAGDTNDASDVFVRRSAR